MRKDDRRAREARRVRFADALPKTRSGKIVAALEGSRRAGCRRGRHDPRGFLRRRKAPRRGRVTDGCVRGVRHNGGNDSLNRMRCLRRPRTGHEFRSRLERRYARENRRSLLFPISSSPRRKHPHRRRRPCVRRSRAHRARSPQIKPVGECDRKIFACCGPPSSYQIRELPKTCGGFSICSRIRRDEDLQATDLLTSVEPREDAFKNTPNRTARTSIASRSPRRARTSSSVAPRDGDGDRIARRGSAQRRSPSEPTTVDVPSNELGERRAPDVESHR